MGGCRVARRPTSTGGSEGEGHYRLFERWPQWLWLVVSALRYGVGRCALVARRGLYGKLGFRKFEFSHDGGGGAQCRRFIGSQCTRAHVELIESCSGRLAFSHFD